MSLFRCRFNLALLWLSCIFYDPLRCFSIVLIVTRYVLTSTISLYPNNWVTRGSFATKRRDGFFWRYTRKCSTEHFIVLCSRFSTFSVTDFSYLFVFLKKTVGNWLHFSLAIVRFCWTISAPQSWILFSCKWQIKKCLSSAWYPANSPSSLSSSFWVPKTSYCDR